MAERDGMHEELRDARSVADVDAHVPGTGTGTGTGKDDR